MNEALPDRQPLNGVRDYELALDEVIERASSTLRIFEHTLSAGFNSPRRHQALRRFLLASRRNTVRIVLHDASRLDRDCPRLLLLLRELGHALNIHETHPPAKQIYDPFLIADDRHYAHRFHFEQMGGLRGLDDPIGARALIERFEEIWEASSPAVSATTLGL
jgi:hypothetical protein